MKTENKTAASFAEVNSTAEPDSAACDSEKNIPITADEYFMSLALEQARLAEEIDEVPIGAVAVRDGRVIATGYNTRETTKCATHHAELLCIERACAALGGWRLPGVTLYHHTA